MIETALVVLLIALAVVIYKRPLHRNGCDGKPFHNGMCRCECDTHYLGL